MSIDLAVDHSSRRIVAIARGPFRASEFVDVLGSMRTSDTWSYGVLLDLRLVTGEPTVAELRAIIPVAAQPGNRQEGRGPVAVVAASPVIYGMACAYAAMSAPGRVQVFNDRDEAERWLIWRQANRQT